MARILCALVMLALCLPASPAPARAALAVASTEALRPVFGRLLGDPPVMHLEAVPDLYEGGYARISLYARDVDIKGMRIDELWIFLGRDRQPFCTDVKIGPRDLLAAEPNSIEVAYE